MDEIEGQEQGPGGGSPAADEARQSSTAPSGDASPSGGGLVGLLRRFDRAFTRAFTAMAMAEDGTRELALEQLDDPPVPDPDDEPAAS